MRKLCWFAFSFTVAIYIAIYFTSIGWIAKLSIIIGMGICGVLFRGKTRKRLLIAACGLACGFGWFSVYNAMFRLPARALIDLSPASYTFEVKAFPRETQYGAVSLMTRLMSDHGRTYDVLLYTNDAVALEFNPGDRFMAEVKLSPSDIRKGEHYDYYQSKGIFLIGNAKSECSRIEPLERIPLRYLPQVIAQRLNQLIQRVFDAEFVGFFVALFTGDKSQFSDGIYAAFRRVGIAHIVAVSGLHIGFLSAVFTMIIKRKNLFTILLQGILLFFFAAVAGNSPSAIRAAFMASTLLIAPLLGREDDRLTTLSMILLLLLIDCPYAATGVSLQLSFAALLGMILCTEKLNLRLQGLIPLTTGKPEKPIRYICNSITGSMAVSIGATVFTILLIALHYGSFSIVALVANLLTLWAVSLTFTLGLIAVFAGLIYPTVGIAIGKLAVLPAKWVIWVAVHLARFPYASISLLSADWFVWFVTTYAILLVWIFAKRKIRPLIPLGSLIIVFSVTLGTQQLALHRNRLFVTILDVGQGSSTLLYSQGEAVLVDCGGNKDNAGDIAADYIQFLGSSHLNALVLTHYDSDHTNGVAELMERVEIDEVYLPDDRLDLEEKDEILRLCDQYNCKVNLVYSDDKVISFGKAKMEIYIPLGGANKNIAGLSALCSVDDYDVLITGDMDMATEGLLLKYKNIPDIELLVVGHHGSKNATSPELLEATKPEIAVISSGYNPYGHPTAEVIARLEEANCMIYRTDESGTLAFAVE